MTDNPKKREWKSRTPHGLSASQFGMALGFMGRVSDYVDYLRNVVDTELEFTGNATTVHGNVTEPKSRALYELLTGTPVSDGGFFIAENDLLGCSPDGCIFEVGPTTHDRTSTHYQNCINKENVENSTISIRIPFKPKKMRKEFQHESSCSVITHSPPQEHPAQRKPCRLLEIKSPFFSLYNGSRKSYQPFGIPQQYMCQMQGQMAIAGVDVCDFFVYLDRPSCQVVAWRVYRSAEFWDWARPKLLQVSEWVASGPPPWLDRRFEFGTFDFSRISVEPLIFPYDISSNSPITDAHSFPFFARFPNPYTSLGHCGERDAVLRVLTSPITRFLFESDDEDEKEEKGMPTAEEKVFYCNYRSFTSGLCPSTLNASATTCSSSLSCCGAVDNGARLAVVKPSRFDSGTVTCRGLQDPIDAPKEGTAVDITMRVRYYLRDFFVHLQPIGAQMAVYNTPTGNEGSPRVGTSPVERRESSVSSVIVVTDSSPMTIASSVEVISPSQ
ncbi:YqaJ like viral recombinase domain [Trypanosoma vivax]|nr:hypothetical protein TRVL_03728 [Trypanosoma vivax]KAH8603424.1 YqaJ like viral recombinase domain [Trypanosoma vivax]